MINQYMDSVSFLIFDNAKMVTMYICDHRSCEH